MVTTDGWQSDDIFENVQQGRDKMPAKCSLLAISQMTKIDLQQVI